MGAKGKLKASDMAALLRGADLIDRVSDIRQKTQLGLRILIGVFLLWLAFRGVSLAKIGELFSQVNYIYIVLALAALLVSGMVKAWRWRLLFHPDENQLRFSKVWRILMMGQMVNILIPARFGEVTRVYLMNQIEDRSAVRVLGTIGIEKLLDVSILISLTAILPLLMPLPDWLHAPSRVLVIAGIIALLVMFSVAYHRSSLSRIAIFLTSFLPAMYRTMILSQLEGALESLSALRHRRINLKLSFWSVVAWLASSLVNYLVFLALGLSLPFIASVFLLLVLHVGIAVPSSPGKIGVFHYLCLLALSVFSVDRGIALGYSTILYILAFGTPSLLGLLFLICDETLTWHGLRYAIQQRQVADSDTLPEFSK